SSKASTSAPSSGFIAERLSAVARRSGFGFWRERKQRGSFVTGYVENVCRGVSRAATRGFGKGCDKGILGSSRVEVGWGQDCIWIASATHKSDLQISELSAIKRKSNRSWS